MRRPRVTITSDDAAHVFRDAPGHLADMPENRRLLLDLVADESYLLGEDRYGTRWYARILDDRGQLWAQRRGNRLRNGGLNPTPRDFFSPLTGFAREKPDG